MRCVITLKHNKAIDGVTGKYISLGEFYNFQLVKGDIFAFEDDLGKEWNITFEFMSTYFKLGLE